MSLTPQKFIGLANFIATHRLGGGTDIKTKTDLLECIEKARSELNRAESFFNENTDDEATDYAIYAVLAAKSRYAYLLSLARKERFNKPYPDSGSELPR